MANTVECQAVPIKKPEMPSLTFAKIVSSKKQGRYAVGGVQGLYLRIEGNSIAWVLRAKIGSTGRRVEVGLGAYCPKTLSLTNARDLARERRKLIRDGADPVKARRDAVQAERERLEAEKREMAKLKTFGECAGIVIEMRTASLRNAKHIAQWRSTLETYAKPLWNRPVSAITKIDVADVLRPIWHSKHETAERLRGRIEAVMDYAKGMDYRDGDNPAEWRGTLEPLLGAFSKEAKPQPSLPHRQIGAFMADIRQRSSMSARALEFLILTATRSGEVIGAKWSEIDLAERLWTIPAARMKAKREHVVPLSDAAVSLLKALPRIVGNDHVFPGTKGALSNMALNQLVRGMNEKIVRYADGKTGEGVVPHGFRSTFREWAGEVSLHPREVIEHALAHQLADKAEAAYQRGSLLPKRVVLMADWAAYCANVQNNVATLKANTVAR